MPKIGGADFFVTPAVKQFPAVDGSSEVPPIGESSTSFPAMSQLLSEAA